MIEDIKQVQTFVLSHIWFSSPQKNSVLLGNGLSWVEQQHPLTRPIPEDLKKSLSFTMLWAVEETIYSHLA